MKTTAPSFAHTFAQGVLKHPEMSHGAVRVGLWLAAVADLQGADTVELFQTDIIRGYHTDAVAVPGVTMRPNTIRSAISALESLQLITVAEGSTQGRAGQRRTCYTLLRGTA